MSLSNSTAGNVVELQTSDRDLSVHKTSTLIKTSDFRLVQIRMPGESIIPTYEAFGEVIIQCLEGCVSINAKGVSKELTSNQLIFLEVADPFTIEAKDNSSLLVTMISPNRNQDQHVGD